LFIYTSDKANPNWKACNDVAFDYDTVALRFRQLKIKSVVVASFDAALEGIPPELESNEMPAVYFFPAREWKGDHMAVPREQWTPL